MKDILEKLLKGEMGIDEANAEIEKRIISEGVSTIDPGREHRTGVPEVILSEGKDPDQVMEIAFEFIKRRGRAILSRIDKDLASIILKRMSDQGYRRTEYNQLSRYAVIRTDDFELPEEGGKVGFITAGTSDIGVIGEAEMVAREMGCLARSYYDVGIAGIHRIFMPVRELEEWKADVIVVAAGREGALPALVSGLTKIPVIGLPVSVGYGIHPKGETALFSMLQSCTPLVVVNIDAGFVAGSVAGKIARRSFEP